MNPSPTPLPQTPARVAMRHRREMFSAASVCALMLLVLGAASLEQSALSPIFKQWMRRGALLGLGVTVAWGAIRALSFGRRMARARSAMDALPEEAYADLLRQSQEDMRAKARAVNESYGPDVRALYESSKGWYIALMGPFYMMLLLGVLYLVGTLLPQADALARLNHIVWHHSPPLPRLGVIGLLCALPGAFLWLLSLPRAAKSALKRDAEIYHRLVLPNDSDEAAGGLSVAQEKEEGGLSITHAKGGLQGADAQDHI